MKKILITGTNSYVGNSIEAWLKQWPDKYLIEKISLRNEKWKDFSFSGYDVVFHVAGIAHKKESPDMKEIYDKVNHQLAVEVLKKSCSDGVKHFIFMSTGAVFTQNDKRHKDIKITTNMNYAPLTMYGKSKRMAETDMIKLKKENKLRNIKIAIIRPPMIYGKGAKGNYNTLSRIAQCSLFFPDIKNQRSMLYVENLCEFIRLLINNQDEGLFHPQNKDLINTANLVACIAKVHSKKIIRLKIFNPIINLMSMLFNPINKAFGSYIYDKEISSHYDWKYCIVGFEESIIKTEVSELPNEDV